MRKLDTLKPRLKAADTRRVAVLVPGSLRTVARIRGRALQHLREQHFRANPLCVMCQARGRTSLATELDHVLALVNGGTNDASNWQGLCVPCHEIKTLTDLAAARLR